MLNYNKLVYAKNERFSFFRVMMYRPDMKGYLLECIDPQNPSKPFYKMVYEEDIPEKLIVDPDEIRAFCEKKLDQLLTEEKELSEKQYATDAKIMAKQEKLTVEIIVATYRAESDPSTQEALRRIRASRQMKKALRRIEKHEKGLKNEFEENRRSQIHDNAQAIRKIQQDIENLDDLLEETPIYDYSKGSLYRSLFGNSIK